MKTNHLKSKLGYLICLLFVGLFFQNFSQIRDAPYQNLIYKIKNNTTNIKVNINSLGQLKDFTFTLYIDEFGRDTNLGTKRRPIASLKEAQKRIDHLLDTMNLNKPKSPFLDTVINIKLYTSGTFKGQVFRWIHPHKNINFLLSNTPGAKATYYGYGHPCYKKKCKADPHNRRPKVCRSESSSCNYGLTFFSAPGSSSKFKASKGYNGYGKIAIRGLKIKYYWSGINVYSHTNTKPIKVKIRRNVFYKVGQNGNPNYWPPAYSAVIFKSVDNSVITGNRFINLNNSEMPSFLHGVYLAKNSDHNTIENNFFRNISGNPIKVRNGSDHIKIYKNTFINGVNSVKNFPVQNWYANWYKDESYFSNDLKPELPSMDIVMNDNKYYGYYMWPVGSFNNSMKTKLCNEKTLVAPTPLSNFYIAHAKQEKTYSRFKIRGVNFNHTHILCD